MSPGDAVLAFSHSGATGEVVGAAAALRARGARVVAVTADAASPLARGSDAVLLAAASGELLGSVPSRSIVAQEAVVNALMAAAVARFGVTAAAFKLNHPGGAIGAA